MVRPSLGPYRKRRDFTKTPEPSGAASKPAKAGTAEAVDEKRGPSKGSGGRFVVHEHHATRLHFDVRLEMGGVLKSWAVPKGPSLDPKERRLAIETEDHPVEYLAFQGTISDGQYGAGEMALWDAGRYTLKPGDDALRSWEKGKLHLTFHGKKLRGSFVLVRSSYGEKQWLFFKEKDEEAEADWQPALILPYGARGERPPGLPTLRTKHSRAITDPEVTSKGRETRKIPVRKKPIKWPRDAVPAPMPDFIEPMLATLADKPFDNPAWVFEMKWDGWRAQLRIDASGMRLTSRSGKSLEAMFPELISLDDKIADDCILDGEVVALDEEGLPRFQLLQNRLKGKSAAGGQGRIVFYVFDLLYYRGRDLTRCTLIDRKGLLRDMLPDSQNLRYSDHFEGGEKVFQEALSLGLEGVVGKLKNGTYRRGRSSEWLKVKTKRRQEAVIAGYTEPRGSRVSFGALVIGVYEGERFVYAGHVGGGFNAKVLKTVHDLLEPLAIKSSPFDPVPKTNEKVQWVKPVTVAEVEFAEWTDDGRMRQPVFIGIRPDKDPKACVRERAQPADKLRQAVEATGKDGKDPVFTNLDKVFWPAEGFTKRDLIEYYRAVSTWMLPHLKDRPLILKRYPNGIEGPPFYQHDIKKAPAFVQTLPVKEDDGSIVTYAVCQNRETLLYLANLAVIAQNPWLSRIPNLGSPDWIVFDLDPQEVAFPDVCAMALYLKSILDDLELTSYCKTSGSRGMHVYVPLKSGYDFEHSLTFAQLVAAWAAREKPDAFTLERKLKDRKKDLIYLDCMQNSHGKSVAAAYSVRERPGACVSAPLEWSEVKRKPRMEDFTIETMPKRLAKKGDLFAEVLRKGNSLEGALKKLEKKMRG